MLAEGMPRQRPSWNPTLKVQAAPAKKKSENQPPREVYETLMLNEEGMQWWQCKGESSV
jgi:hypothetical protein